MVRYKRGGATMSSEAHKRSSIKYNRKQDSITLRPSKERGAAVRAAAAAAGQPLQVYVMQAVEARMTAEGQPIGGQAQE